ncbi:MAG: site-specific integrase [Hyphomicrobiaceae bacterium]
MTKKKLPTKVSAFAAKGMPTIEDALKVMAGKAVEKNKRQSIVRDVKRLCRKERIPPYEMIAHPANLNPRIRRLTGISEKRRSNIAASMRALLSYLPQQNRSFKTPLTSDWLAAERAIHDTYRRASVQCMMRYGSTRNIKPVDFNNEASSDLLEALINEKLNCNPVAIHQNAVRASNWLRLHVSGWDVPFLTPPRYAQTYIEKWENLPEWCRRITVDFLNRSTTDDPFELGTPMRAWRPVTSDHYETLLRRFFSMASRVHANFERPRDWREVATFDFAEGPLKWLLDKNGHKRGQVMGANIAALLARIARNPDGKRKLSIEEKKASSGTVEDLLEMAARLRSSKRTNSKNRERVRPLKDESNLAKLFLLPFALQRELVNLKSRSRKRAVLAQLAVALMLLTFCPLRISTLSLIRDRHLVWSKPDRRGGLTLELDGNMLKGGEPASVPLPKECARIIELYFREYRPLLFRFESDFLFPSNDLKFGKKPNLLSHQIKKLIWKKLGMKVNPHLFRHLVHIVILRKYPGAYSMISDVLMHGSLETAVRNYSHFNIELSMEAYQKLVMEVQGRPQAD